jgi:ribosome-associated translation inhibitor RaiA
MRVQHLEKGLHYSAKEFMLIARKIGSLATHCSRIMDESSIIRVVAERAATKKEADSVLVTITVELPGKVLRAESRRPAPVDAVERCVEKLDGQLAKYKERHSAGIHANRRR